MRPRTLLTPACAALASVALALAGSGCGAGGAAAIDPVASAAQTTVKAGGAQVSISATGAVAGQTLSISGHGTVNFRGDESELFMQMSGLPSGVPGVSGGALEITSLQTGGAVYVGSPLFTGRLPGGARWLRVDLGKVAQELGLDAGDFTTQGMDPGQYLQLLRAAGSVRDAGPASVRGVPTTHYEATVDLRRAAEDLPSPNRAAAEQAMSKLIEQTGAASYPVQVWIDGHGMIRRLQLTIPESSGAERGSIAMTEELFDFGPTPAVAAPPQGETYEAPIPSLGG